MNNLSNGLQSNTKPFADNTSVFSAVQDITTSTISLSQDLSKISEWVVQWKMNFNLVLTNKLKSYYSVKKQVPSLIHFHDNSIHQVQLQKHLALCLDPKLSFDEHIKSILNKK